jgi:uncharacterized protein (DUF1501 family)
MHSDQLSAFDLAAAPESLKKSYGDSDFGRGCLAAARLVDVGVRCVEVSLDGWDSHANNHDVHATRLKSLDPAFSTLLTDLEERGLLDTTLVVWAGEFGRTPTINPAGGRDHWPHGFCVAMAGCGIKGGALVGETSPDPKLDKKNRAADLAGSRPIEDVHATILAAIGIEYEKELITPIGRPLPISQGTPIGEVLTG